MAPGVLNGQRPSRIYKRASKLRRKLMKCFARYPTMANEWSRLLRELEAIGL